MWRECLDAFAGPAPTYSWSRGPAPYAYLVLPHQLLAGATSCAAQASGALALNCVLRLRCSDVPGATEAALAYVSLQPDDSFGYLLLSSCLVAHVARGVTGILSEAGLSTSAHLLMHPLLCASCQLPLQAPTACTNLGLLMCQACRAREAGAGPLCVSSTAKSLLELMLPPHWEATLEARQRGNAALAAGGLEEALGHYERALALDPSHFVAQANTALILLQQGKPLASLAVADEAAAKALRFSTSGMSSALGS